jgi:methionine-rich copper-binding protein CopC
MTKGARMSIKRLTSMAAAGVCAALVAPAASFAHTPIKSVSPKAGATADRDLRAVKVSFRGAIPDGELTVRTASGTKVSRGDGRLVRDDRELRVRLKAGLRAGSYRATVRWLSSDGHVQSKSWAFRLR